MADRVVLKLEVVETLEPAAGGGWLVTNLSYHFNAAYEDSDVRTLAVQLRHLAAAFDAHIPRGLINRTPTSPNTQRRPTWQEEH